MYSHVSLHACIYSRFICFHLPASASIQPSLFYRDDKKLCCLLHVGGVAVVNSYAAAATTEEDRRWGLAGATGSQTLGFVIGPGMVEEKGIMIMMM